MNFSSKPGTAFHISSKPGTAFHFNNLIPPLAPNKKEVEIYETYVERTGSKKVLLLGYTKELIHLATTSIDINPPSENNVTIKKDWFEALDEYILNGTHFDIIMGDGVLNLVDSSLISKALTICDTLIIRFFTEHIDGMKYATRFRDNTPMILPDVIILTQDKCKILVWYRH